MKNNASIVYNVCLIIGDSLALIAAFATAYILRVSLSSRAISQQVTSLDYLQAVLVVLPFFVFVFALLGLYSNRIHEQRFREIGLLLTGSFIGVLFIISYSYIQNTPIFPARLVTVYAFGLAFAFVLLFRTIARGIRRQLFTYGIGINNVLVIGDTRLAHTLIDSMRNTAVTGYKVQALVANKIRSDKLDNRYLHYQTFAEAVDQLDSIHTIIQTKLYADNGMNDEILTYAQNNHVAYRFVPGNSELFTGNIDVEVFHSVPVVAVHQTPLVGWGRVVKRLFDIIASFLALVIASPLMLLIAIAVKLSSGGGSVFFSQHRLSRFDSTVRIYKFRSQYAKYDGTTPEEAFTMMGRPELGPEYRANGDFLIDDPRVTIIGKFIRATSLDELPQLYNVLRGDISLVGPRALVAIELQNFAQRNLLLSVKSGLTGLAQVSGRRDITFDERRRLDLYYVQNWTFWGDLTILIRTIWMVIFHKGAR